MQAQDLTLGFVELHEVHVGLLLRHIKVSECHPFPLVYQLHHPARCYLQICWVCTQFHCPCQNKDINYYWSQHGPLRPLTFYWFPAGHLAIGSNLWIQPSRQLLFLQIIHPSQQYLFSLEVRMSWGTTTKALQKFR